MSNSFSDSNFKAALEQGPCVWPGDVEGRSDSELPRAGGTLPMIAIIKFEWNRKFTAEEQTALSAVALHHSSGPPCFGADGQLKDNYDGLVMDVQDAVQFGEFTVCRALPTKPQLPVTAPCPPANEKCSVAVPGLGLLLITNVRVELDLCTDRLQALLDEGWRILAICPQPDSRRPDYVLGRG